MRAFLLIARLGVRNTQRHSVRSVNSKASQPTRRRLNTHSVMTSPRRFVSDFFPTSETNTTPRSTCDALLILNYHLPAATTHMWRMVTTTNIVCADGGANRLFDEMPNLVSNEFANEDDLANKKHLESIRDAYVPHAIVGDLDSVRPEVLAFYRERGSLCVDLSLDQETTDLVKAVTWLLRKNEQTRDETNASTNTKTSSEESREESSHPHTQKTRILVTGALGGRFDHEMAHLSALHTFSDTNIVLLGRTSSAQLIPVGETVVVPDVLSEGPTCGLVPLAGPAIVTTTGLKWGLEATKLSFGTLISTSNEIDMGGWDGRGEGEEGEGEILPKENSHSVRITTNAPLIWTTDVTKARGLSS